jgi:hypothetical protein
MIRPTLRRRRLPAVDDAFAAWLRAELVDVADSIEPQHDLAHLRDRIRERPMGCSCPMPGGYESCHCGACHRNFTSVSAFDQHQTMGGEAVVCYDPALRGLVIVQRQSRGLALWGWPGRRPPHPAAAQKISAPNGGEPV